MDGTKGEVQAEWPEEREWSPTDYKWKQKATTGEQEALSTKDRGACPFIPSGNYLLFKISTVDFFLDSGFIIPNEDDPSGSGLHAPLMTIVACGPDVKNYKPGDLILTHPRNPELQVAWRDPRSADKETAYFFMKDEFVLAHYDKEVVEQMKRRGRYLFKQQQEKQAEKEAHEKVLNSPLHPNPDAKDGIVDARGEPITKKGMQEEQLPK
jgi:hypothetical protein